MKLLSFFVLILLSYPCPTRGGEKEEAFLKETIIPLAGEFLLRIGQTNCLPLTTNQVGRYKVNYFNDRSGCAADIVLTNRWVVEFVSGSTVLPGGKTTQQPGKTEVRRFQRPIKTFYALELAPKEKIEAVKSLNLQNKLNKTTALLLVKKYFELLGHKEENFHQPELTQCYWSGGNDNRGGPLPYYEASWYRKDVNLTSVDNGNTDIPQVLITVSGIDSSLIYYSRLYLPIDSDF